VERQEAELRRDRFTERAVWYIPGRIGRPSDWVPLAQPKEDDRKDCPFCPGHEGETPPEVWALRPEGGAPNAPGWEIRVIPNKYPIGEAHELIIETPQHNADFPDLPLEHLRRVMEAYRERLAALSQGGWEYVALFKNHGRGAGATRIHPHSQIVGLPLIPPLLEEELRCAQRFFEREGKCLYCKTLGEELDRGERVVFRNEEFVVWCPFVSRMSFECWIAPLSHAADFRTLSSSQGKALAEALQRALEGLRRVWPSPRPFSYNFYLHTAPSRLSTEIEREYHWHFEVLPRLGRLAGLEWGTGLYANPITPEEAARRLREALKR